MSCCRGSRTQRGTAKADLFPVVDRGTLQDIRSKSPTCRMKKIQADMAREKTQPHDKRILADTLSQPPTQEDSSTLRYRSTCLSGWDRSCRLGRQGTERIVSCRRSRFPSCTESGWKLQEDSRTPHHTLRAMPTPQHRTIQHCRWS